MQKLCRIHFAEITYMFYISKQWRAAENSVLCIHFPSHDIWHHIQGNSSESDKMYKGKLLASWQCSEKRIV